VPLSQTAKEKIDKLRDWAKTRARLATSVESKVTQKSVRALDL
jgi:hypothetical protein